MPPIDIDTLNLPQQGHPLAGVVTAGQPSASQFSAIKAAGVSKVINLRPATEDAGFDEAAVRTSSSIGEALEEALSAARAESASDSEGKGESAVLVTGSITVVGEAREILGLPVAREQRASAQATHPAIAQEA